MLSHPETKQSDTIEQFAHTKPRPNEKNKLEICLLSSADKNQWTSPSKWLNWHFAKMRIIYHQINEKKKLFCKKKKKSSTWKRTIDTVINVNALIKWNEKEMNRSITPTGVIADTPIRFQYGNI